MKKIIGVMPLWDDEKESVWMLPGYLEGIKFAGGLPMIFPMTTDAEDLRQLCDMCDGILFTGGHDVNPALYGETPMNDSVVFCEERDLQERYVFDYCLEKDIPALGICRGIQFMNVCMGGTLWQDLPSQSNSLINHHMNAPYDRTAHEVLIGEKSRLFELLGRDKIGVNSYHHQAIKELGKGLVCEAVSSDGLIEAVTLPGYKYICAVQWHPEFSFKSDVFSQKIFKSFVANCQSAIL